VLLACDVAKEVSAAALAALTRLFPTSERILAALDAHAADSILPYLTGVLAAAPTAALLSGGVDFKPPAGLSGDIDAEERAESMQSASLDALGWLLRMCREDATAAAAAAAPGAVHLGAAARAALAGALRSKSTWKAALGHGSAAVRRAAYRLVCEACVCAPTVLCDRISVSSPSPSGTPLLHVLVPLPYVATPLLSTALHDASPALQPAAWEAAVTLCRACPAVWGFRPGDPTLAPQPLPPPPQASRSDGDGREGGATPAVVAGFDSVVDVHKFVAPAIAACMRASSVGGGAVEDVAPFILSLIATMPPRVLLSAASSSSASGKAKKGTTTGITPVSAADAFCFGVLRALWSGVLAADSAGAGRTPVLAAVADVLLLLCAVLTRLQDGSAVDVAPDAAVTQLSAEVSTLLAVAHGVGVRGRVDGGAMSAGGSARVADAPATLIPLALSAAASSLVEVAGASAKLASAAAPEAARCICKLELLAQSRSDAVQSSGTVATPEEGLRRICSAAWQTVLYLQSVPLSFFEAGSGDGGTLSLWVPSADPVVSSRAALSALIELWDSAQGGAAAVPPVELMACAGAALNRQLATANDAIVHLTHGSDLAMEADPIVDSALVLAALHGTEAILARIEQWRMHRQQLLPLQGLEVGTTTRDTDLVVFARSACTQLESICKAVVSDAARRGTGSPAALVLQAGAVALAQALSASGGGATSALLLIIGQATYDRVASAGDDIVAASLVERAATNHPVPADKVLMQCVLEASPTLALLRASTGGSTDALFWKGVAAALTSVHLTGKSSTLMSFHEADGLLAQMLDDAVLPAPALQSLLEAAATSGTSSQDSPALQLSIEVCAADLRVSALPDLILALSQRLAERYAQAVSCCVASVAWAGESPNKGDLSTRDRAAADLRSTVALLTPEGSIALVNTVLEQARVALDALDAAVLSATASQPSTATAALSPVRDFLEAAESACGWLVAVASVRDCMPHMSRPDDDCGRGSAHLDGLWVADARCWMSAYRNSVTSGVRPVGASPATPSLLSLLLLHAGIASREVVGYDFFAASALPLPVSWCDENRADWLVSLVGYPSVAARLPYLWLPFVVSAGWFALLTAMPALTAVAALEATYTPADPDLTVSLQLGTHRWLSLRVTDAICAAESVSGDSGDCSEIGGDSVALASTSLYSAKVLASHRRLGIAITSTVANRLLSNCTRSVRQVLRHERGATQEHLCTWVGALIALSTTLLSDGSAGSAGSSLSPRSGGAIMQTAAVFLDSIQAERESLADSKPVRGVLVATLSSDLDKVRTRIGDVACATAEASLDLDEGSDAAHVQPPCKPGRGIAASSEIALAVAMSMGVTGMDASDTVEDDRSAHVRTTASRNISGADSFPQLLSQISEDLIHCAASTSEAPSEAGGVVATAAVRVSPANALQLLAALLPTLCASDNVVRQRIDKWCAIAVEGLRPASVSHGSASEPPAASRALLLSIVLDAAVAASSATFATLISADSSVISPATLVDTRDVLVQTLLASSLQQASRLQHADCPPSGTARSAASADENSTMLIHAAGCLALQSLAAMAGHAALKSVQKAKSDFSPLLSPSLRNCIAFMSERALVALHGPLQRRAALADGGSAMLPLDVLAGLQLAPAALLLVDAPAAAERDACDAADALASAQRRLEGTSDATGGGSPDAAEEYIPVFPLMAQPSWWLCLGASGASALQHALQDDRGLQAQSALVGARAGRWGAASVCAATALLRTALSAIERESAGASVAAMGGGDESRLTPAAARVAAALWAQTLLPWMLPAGNGLTRDDLASLISETSGKGAGSEEPCPMAPAQLRYLCPSDLVRTLTSSLLISVPLVPFTASVTGISAAAQNAFAAAAARHGDTLLRILLPPPTLEDSAETRVSGAPDEPPLAVPVSAGAPPTSVADVLSEPPAHVSEPKPTGGLFSSILSSAATTLQSVTRSWWSGDASASPAAPSDDSATTKASTEEAAVPAAPIPRPWYRPYLQYADGDKNALEHVIARIAAGDDEEDGGSSGLWGSTAGAYLLSSASAALPTPSMQSGDPLHDHVARRIRARGAKKATENLPVHDDDTESFNPVAHGRTGHSFLLQAALCDGEGALAVELHIEALCNAGIGDNECEDEGDFGQSREDVNQGVQAYDSGRPAIESRTEEEEGSNAGMPSLLGRAALAAVAEGTLAAYASAVWATAAVADTQDRDAVAAFLCAPQQQDGEQRRHNVGGAGLNRVLLACLHLLLAREDLGGDASSGTARKTTPSVDTSAGAASVRSSAAPLHLQEASLRFSPAARMYALAHGLLIAIADVFAQRLAAFWVGGSIPRSIQSAVEKYVSSQVAPAMLEFELRLVRRSSSRPVGTAPGGMTSDVRRSIDGSLLSRASPVVGGDVATVVLAGRDDAVIVGTWLLRWLRLQLSLDRRHGSTAASLSPLERPVSGTAGLSSSSGDASGAPGVGSAPTAADDEPAVFTVTGSAATRQVTALYAR
jgi:hypothetical protein